MSSVAKLRDEMQNVPKTFKDIFKNSQKNDIRRIFLLTYSDLVDQKPVNKVKLT